jgi:hypothetical protein
VGVKNKRNFLLEINYSLLSAEMHRCRLATGLFTLIESSMADQKGSKRGEDAVRVRDKYLTHTLSMNTMKNFVSVNCSIVIAEKC